MPVFLSHRQLDPPGPPSHITATISGENLYFWIDQLARASDTRIVSYRLQSDEPGQALRTAPAHYVRGLISASGFRKHECAGMQ